MDCESTLGIWARCMEAEMRYHEAKRRIFDDPEARALIAEIESVELPAHFPRFRMPTLDEQIDDVLRKCDGPSV